MTHLIQQYTPTIFENYTSPVQMGKSVVNLSLWDTAGQEDYDRLRPLSYPDTDVVIMTFSITDWDSFDNIQNRWIPEIKHFLPNVPIVLVGTKADLRHDRHGEIKGGATRWITSEEGAKLANSIHAKYFECSAKYSQGVEEIFQYSAKCAMSKKRQRNCKVL